MNTLLWILVGCIALGFASLSCFPNLLILAYDKIREKKHFVSERERSLLLYLKSHHYINLNREIKDYLPEICSMLNKKLIHQPGDYITLSVNGLEYLRKNGE